MYLDPGTGSFALQLAIAGLLAGMVSIKMHWRRLRAWMHDAVVRPHPAPAHATLPPVGRVDAPH